MLTGVTRGDGGGYSAVKPYGTTRAADQPIGRPLRQCQESQNRLHSLGERFDGILQVAQLQRVVRRDPTTQSMRVYLVEFNVLWLVAFLDVERDMRTLGDCLGLY